MLNTAECLSDYLFINFFADERGKILNTGDLKDFRKVTMLYFLARCSTILQ
jgi:hypothetical protein